MKNFTSKEIHKKYLDSSLEKRNEVLYNALCIMEQYNGRSKFLCIAMAMGYENTEGGYDTFTELNNN